ncbi:MAG: hypothetical protein K0U36_00940, partial [Alphaproteobacteria bacterium]|nr:hypothetical protein [Alphaproteobacteria bacterium]
MSDSLTITETKTDGLDRQFTVEYPVAYKQQRFQSILMKEAKKADIKGFRKGKVPPRMIEQRYGDALKDLVQEELLDEVMQALRQDHAVTPISPPSVDRQTTDSAETLVVDIVVAPANTDQYLEGMAFTRYTIVPTDEDIDAELTKMASYLGEESPVTEEGAVVALGDVVNVKTSATYLGADDLDADDANKDKDSATKDEEEADAPRDHAPGMLRAMSRDDWRIHTGNNQLLAAAFEESLVGKQIGTTETITLADFSDERLPDYWKEAKPMQVVIEIIGHSTFAPAALDDALAARLGQPDFDGLKAVITQSITAEKNKASSQFYRQQVLDAVIARADFAPPERAVQAEFMSIWHDVSHARDEGKLDPEDANKDEQALQDQYKAIALRRVVSSYALFAIAEKHLSVPTREEIET